MQGRIKLVRRPQPSTQVHRDADSRKHSTQIKSTS